MKKKNWKFIFNNFIKKKINNYSYKNLLILSGHYQSKSGGFTVKKWLEECKLISDRIKLKRNSKVLEIGCGSGALLKYFKNNNKIYGVDFSKELLEISKKAIPKGNFFLGDANKIKFSKNFFDAVLMQSCIQYFPSDRYFKDVVDRCNFILKPKSSLFIGEIVDRDKLKKFTQYRKRQIGIKKYKRMYEGKANKNLKFFSLNRIKCIEILKKNFENIEIYNSVKRGKETDFYRFNVFCTKKN